MNNSLLKQIQEINPKAATNLIALRVSGFDMNLSLGLSGAFTWKDTPQGHAYWEDIYHQLYKRKY